MSVCAPVSREDLLSNFLEMPGEVVDKLRTIIIGADYAVHNDGLVGPYDAALGVSSAWPGLGVSEVVDLATAVVRVENGLVRYYTETGAVGPTKAVQYGVVPNAIQHNGGATIFTGPSFTPALNVAVAIGDFVRLDDNGLNTFTTVVTGFTYILGSPTVLLLRDNLPAWATGGAFSNLTLAEVVVSEDLASTDVTLSASLVQADPAITLATTRTGSAYPLIGSTGYSAIYTDYRAFRNVLPTQGVISVTTIAELSAYFVDSTSPESGLGFAVRHALAPVQSPPATNPPAVLFIAIDANTPAGWQAQLNRILRRNDWYTIAPLTEDPVIQALIVATVTARNVIGLWSRADFVIPLTLTEVVFAGGATVLVDQSLTPGFDRTVTRDGGAAAPFTGAVSGDIIDVAGSDAVIETVISAQTVIITTPLAPGPLQILNSVIHPLTIQEQADDYETRAAAFNSRSISVIFPPNPTWNGAVVDGFLFAAATAGLRGYTMPHQSLTGVLMEDGWAVPQSAYEFLGYLTDLADAGCFVFEDCESQPGRAVVAAANTTDQSTTINSREGLVANEDAVRRFLKDIAGCYEGRTKVTAATINAIRQSVAEGIQFLLSTTVVQPFGAIIVSGVVRRPYQDPNQADILIVPVDIVIAVGLEEVALVVNVTLQAAI